MKKITTLLFITIALFIVAPLSLIGQSADAIEGIWMVPEKDAKIEIYEDEKGEYNGKIVWLLDAVDEDGDPRKDIENSDPKLADRELIGMNVVWGFNFNKEAGKWIDGAVYNSRNGKTYAGFIKLQENGTLYLRGHVKGFKFLGKTNIWERVTL